MKIFYQKLKSTQFWRKFKITEIDVWKMFGEWTEADCYTELLNINRVGNEAKDEPSKD